MPVIRLECHSLVYFYYPVLRSQQPSVDLYTDYVGELFLSHL